VSASGPPLSRRCSWHIPRSWVRAAGFRVALATELALFHASTGPSFRRSHPRILKTYDERGIGLMRTQSLALQKAGAGNWLLDMPTNRII